MENDLSYVVEAVQQAQTDAAPVEISPVQPPSTDLHVSLPVGLMDPVLGLVREAEVRELNGFDEEAVARCKTQGAALAVVLDRATVRIGDQPVSKALLEQLTLGDRVEILLAIRRATWGDVAETRAQCPQCRQWSTFAVSITSDIPRRELSDPVAEYRFEVELAPGRIAELQWPSGKVHAQILSGALTTSAQLATALIADCVQELGSIPLFDDNAAKALPMRERTKLVEAITAGLPGPVMETARKTCSECDADVEVPLDLGSMFLV